MNIWIISPFNLIGLALEALLAGIPGVNPSGRSQSISEFANHLQAGEPLLGLWLLYPHSDLETLALLHDQHPGLRVVCLAFSWTPAQAHTALQAGASGCVDAAISREELAEALRQAWRGEVVLSSGIQRALIIDWVAQKEAVEPGFEALSTRELEVLSHVSQGLSNKQIAQSMYLSVRTVENHLSKIYSKLNVNSRTEAAVIALQHGWVKLPSP